MLPFVNASILLLLAIVVFQDFKLRQISWFLIPLLFIAFIIKGLFYINLEELIHNSLFNAGFVIIQFVCLTIYMSIKNKKIANIINSYLGIGDVLFFIVICVAFSPINFIMFYLVSLLFTLVAFLCYKLISKEHNKEIPLAGAMSGILILMIIVSFFYQRLDFYNDDFFISCFIK